MPDDLAGDRVDFEGLAGVFVDSGAAAPALHWEPEFVVEQPLEVAGGPPVEAGEPDAFVDDPVQVSLEDVEEVPELVGDIGAAGLIDQATTQPHLEHWTLKRSLEPVGRGRCVAKLAEHMGQDFGGDTNVEGVIDLVTVKSSEGEGVDGGGVDDAGQA